MSSRLPRLATAIDRLADMIIRARLWWVDILFGAEPPTPADEKRAADREKFRKAFPGVLPEDRGRG
jgi:hypothetical protein